MLASYPSNSHGVTLLTALKSNRVVTFGERRRIAMVRFRCPSSFGRSSPTISRKAVGAWATFQPLIPRGGTIRIVDAHRDGKRFVVRAKEKLTAFFELESAIRSSNGHDRAAVTRLAA